MTVPTADDEMCDAAIAALGVRCRPTEELVAELAAAGIDLGSHAVDRLEAVLHGRSDFIDLDAGWVGVGATLDGTRWITAVDAEGARLDCLAFSPDLLLLGWWALDAPLTLAETGDDLSPDDDLDADLLIGPRGWLDPYAGGNVEVRIDGTTLHLAPAVVGDAPADMVAVLRETFEQHATFAELRDFDDVAADLTQIGVDELLWESLVARRDVFAAQPIPPIDVLVEAAGFVRDGHAVLRGDVDRAALRAWRLRNHLASTYDLEGDQIEQAEIAIGMSLTVMSDAVDPLGPPDELAGAARFLAALLGDVAVCDALFGHHLDNETPPLELAAFARLIVDNLAAGEGAGPRWLLGRALDFGNDPRGALAALEGAVATGEEHSLALIALAGLRADAGQAREAVALLRRAGVEAEVEEEADPADEGAFDLLREVAGFAARSSGAQAGRNDPCPCGSGRKYKACHLGKERHDLVDRGPWLYAKIYRYMRAHNAELVVTIAEAMSAGTGEELSVFDVLDSYLVADIASGEGEAGEEFVAARGALLPDDEAELATRWVNVERSLFDVEERKDTKLRLHDLRSDAYITVTNMNRGSDSRPGDLLLGRPLPIADTWRAYAGLLKVDAAWREEVLDALARRDPVEIADLTGRCVARSRARGDGRIVDLHALIDQDLDEVAEPAPRRAGTDDRERRTRPDDARPASGADDQVTDFERLWLDEPVPALGGLTPRQAADDPIARDDLERLLDGFEGRAGVMNIGRLRKALGV